MALSLLGIEQFAAAPGGSGTSQTLTIPVGTVAILFAMNRDSGIGTPTVTFGGASLSPEQMAGSNHTLIYKVLDISGRANDDLTWAGSNYVNRWTAYYIAGNEVALLGSNTTDDFNPVDFGAPPVSPSNCIGIIAAQTHIAFSGDIEPGSGMTEDFDEEHNNLNQWHGHRVGADDETLVIDINGSSATSFGRCNMVVYEAQPLVILEPTAMALEAGFVDGISVAASGDVTLPMGIPIGAEAGFVAGITLDTTGSLQVALVGVDREVVGHTTGGADGQVLTYHEASKPTWEDATAGASALDDLTDVNAPAPGDGNVLAWNDAAGEWQAVAPGAPTIDWAESGDLSTQAFGDAKDAGTSAEVPRADHKHAMPAAPESPAALRVYLYQTFR